MNVLVIAYLLGVASPTALNFDGVADPLIPEETPLRHASPTALNFDGVPDPLIPEETPLRHDHNQLMQIDAVLAEAGEGTSLRHESSEVEEPTPQSDGVLEAALRASQAREGFLRASQARLGSGSEHMCQSGQLKEGGGVALVLKSISQSFILESAMSFRENDRPSMSAR